METIRVNMTPCEDIKTIHASQNDNEAREWEFELHNNGEVIDAGGITDQIVFKAYKGGTEQILHENGSVPVTAPFLGDIRYPQGLLTDQEFTYRESPTEEDGLANIVDIKGQTLKWNQLIASNETVNLNRDSARTYNISTNNTRSVVGHKYYFATTITSDNTNGGLNCRFGSDFNVGKGVGRHSTIFTANDTNNASIYCYIQSNEESGTAISFKDSVFFDLTLMFGQGNEPTTAEEFTSLFPLPYYAYNQGTLLSFMGNGIKTVGKNQSQLVSMSTVSGGYINASSGNIATVKKGVTYTLSFDNLTTSTSNVVARLLVNGAWVRQGEKNLVANSRWDLTFTAIDDGVLGLSAGLGSQYSEVKVFDNIQLEFGSMATSYEPYTSSTLSLPISTYFPTGMKDVPDYTNGGKIYDEMTSNKADTRVGSVDLGSLPWTYESSINSMVSAISDIKSPARDDVAFNGILPIARIIPASQRGTTTGIRAYIFQNENELYIRESSYTDATAFKTAMSGVYLYYELATPTETSFTTASLVTENAEIPLSNEDGVLIGKCTEQLSAEPGFRDAKIKLADTDGECYSNKVQLHIERSPQ